MALERELKLEVDEAFKMPDLTTALGLAIVTSPEARLEAVYFDTAGSDLGRWGVTLRYRRGDSGGDRWTLKLPDPDGTAKPAPERVMSRHEIDVVHPAGQPPAQLAELVRVYTNGAALQPVATLTTSRTRHAVLGRGDADIAEIDDDTVRFQLPDGRSGSFRQIEVEISEDAPKGLVSRAASALRKAGARPAPPEPKLVRAIGEPPFRYQSGAGGPPPASGRPRRRKGMTVASVVTAALRTSLDQLMIHDPFIRRGHDPEVVHKARVATRQLRSDLATFKSVLDGAWVEQRRHDIGRLASLLGALRDDDVLLIRLVELVAGLDETDRVPAGIVLDQLRERRQRDWAELRSYLGGPEYLTWVSELVRSLAEPPLLNGEQTARRVLAPLVGARWRQLKTRVGNLDDHPADADLHEVRIAVKRCRYAAEAASPALGKDAARLARALKGGQTVLGDLQDASVAISGLRSAAFGAPPEQALAIGLLIAAEGERAGAAREAWPAAWKRIRKAAKAIEHWSD